MEPHAPAPEEPQQVPKRTTPTWEMELLLSGATVFALWQIAGAMAPFASEMMPRLSPSIAQILSVIYIYLSGGVIMIGLAFILHLILRAHWVALVGMHSVFPNGLRTDKLGGGPIMREALLARWQDMEAAIERADNRATVVFGLGIGVASVLIPITITVVVLYGVTAALCWAVGRMDTLSWVFPVVSMLVLLPYVGVQLVDRYFGKRMAPKGRAYRTGLRIIGAYSQLGLGREANPLVTLYSSNVGNRKGTVVVMVVMMVSLLVASVSLFAQRMDLGVGNYRVFPEPYRGMPDTLDGRYYASMHDPGASPLVPHIPDPVVRGDYLRLVIPYVPFRQAGPLERCADKVSAAESPADDGTTGTSATTGSVALREAARRSALLACWGRLHTLRLDGQPLALTPQWYTDPRRNLRGLVYMVPVHDLARGRHELELRNPDPREPGSEEPVPIPDRIAFWR
ncbi:hypothetical protein [Arenimonas sp. MALMAid1274]|uniref:hypothetical protein n=1 Tax=Arenimonas sp. MALMAid1274 TaxID=3411630 RepID=UPI003BA33188